MNRRVALENLKDTNAVLKSLGTIYWLDCGTLLGAIREDDLLEHDTDVDFGVWSTEHHEAIAEAMYRVGFSKERFFGEPKKGFEQSFVRDRVKVDLFYFYPLGRNRVWQGSWLDEYLIVSVFDRTTVLPPTPMLFQGVETFGPHQPALMLEARYGDWTQVVTAWDWAKDPKCITDATHLTKEEEEMAEQTYSLTAPNGTQVEVTGAARRDELVNNRGYTEGKKTTAKKTTRKKASK